MRGALARVLAATAVVGFLGIGVARPETIDEIVAKVNDDVITKSELDSEEQALLQELYRRFSGTELDAQVAKAKKYILRQLIDRRLLIQRAGHLFDVSKMEDYFLRMFMEQQNIKSEKDLEKLLTEGGMTVAEWRKKLVEYSAPQQVLRAEVADRIAISEQEARVYYDAHPDEFVVPAEATIREIVVTATPADRDEARARAEAARARAVTPGADFAAIASEVSAAGTKASGGLLGPIKKGDLAAPLEAAAFSVPVGEISEVIEVEHGFHILKIESRIEEAAKPFATVQAEIESKLQNERFEADSKIYLKKVWSEATIWVSPKYESRLAPAE